MLKGAHMPLLVKQPGQDPHDAAGVHALIIGVSNYPHVAGGASPTSLGLEFELGQLTSAARSASDFAKWLWQDYKHPALDLKTMTVLLSPSGDDEIDPAVAALLPDGQSYAATRDAVDAAILEFKAMCDGDRDNVAIVYVAGHGVQLTKHGAVLLLEDFAENPQRNKLYGALDIQSFHDHMNREDSAQTQFWFVDTCRQKPEVAREFERLTGALDFDVHAKGAAICPLYLASAPDSSAYGVSGDVSLFRTALKWALEEKGAARSPDELSDGWYVSATSLSEELREKVEALAAQHGLIQTVISAGQTGAAVFHSFAEPPDVAVEISLDPDDAKDDVTWSISDDRNTPLFENRHDWPGRETLKAGLYILAASANGPWQPDQKILRADTPPTCFEKVKVAP
jgi:hypothetical protein